MQNPCKQWNSASNSVDAQSQMKSQAPPINDGESRKRLVHGVPKSARLQCGNRKGQERKGHVGAKGRRILPAKANCGITRTDFGGEASKQRRWTWKMRQFKDFKNAISLLRPCWLSLKTILWFVTHFKRGGEGNSIGRLSNLEPWHDMTLLAGFVRKLMPLLDFSITHNWNP